MSRRALLGLVLALAGCAGSPGPMAPPAASLADFPDFRGSWTGTWGGGPVRLVITEQDDQDWRSGVYVGSWQVLGQRVPGVSGVLTSAIAGDQVSASVKGWLTISARGALTLWLEARSVNGVQRLTLVSGPPDRLAGAGDSDFRWGPRGPIELSRSSPARTGAKTAS
ncbi:MAG TPA: hypothetical protein VID04_05755 [Methylomirabilota bacterium]